MYVLPFHSNSQASTSLTPNLKQTPEDSRQELTAQIDDLLNTLSNKFSGVSSEIFAKSESGTACPDETVLK